MAAATSNASPLVNPKEVLGESICTERTPISSIGGKQGEVCGTNGSLLDISSKFRLQPSIEINGSCMVVLGAMGCKVNLTTHGAIIFKYIT